MDLERLVVSADRKTLLALSNDETDRILIYDLEAKEFAGVLVAGEFHDVAISADGSIAATVGSAGTLLWNLDPDTWADMARDIAGRELTDDERANFGLADL